MYRVDAKAQAWRRQSIAVKSFMMASSHKEEDFYYQVYVKHGGLLSRHFFEDRKNFL